MEIANKTEAKNNEQLKKNLGNYQLVLHNLQWQGLDLGSFPKSG